MPTMLATLTLLVCTASIAAPAAESIDPGRARVVVMGEAAWPGTPRGAHASGPLAPLPERNSAMLRLPSLPDRAAGKATLSPPARELPLLLGEPRDTLQASISRLRVEWSAPVNGRQTARLSVTSPGARALRTALRTESPQSIDVRVQGSDSEAILAARREGDPRRPQEDFWTPVTDGERQDIELTIEHRPELPLPRITVPVISHFAAPVRTRTGAAATRTQAANLKNATRISSAKADLASCNENVVCLSNPTNAFLNAARASVKLVFTRQGSSYACSGTLINDSEARTQVPYVLTAAHCVDSQSTAASTNAFFFFEADACGSDDVSSFHQLSSGASLVHVNTTSDVALLRLNDPAPAGSWFSGWDANVIPDGTGTLFLHHPDGGPKVYSIGLTLPPSLEDDVTALHHLVTWLSGSSAGGSSGGGLLTLAGDQYLVRGVLHGGSAHCAFSGQPQNPLNRDFFTHLDEDYEALRKILLGGPTPLRNYGDLWNSTTELGWGLTVFQAPDNQVLLAWYTHDDGGNPVWYLSLGGKWVSAVRYEGVIARVRSTPATMVYDPTRLTTNNVGTLAIEFSAIDRATMTFSLNGVTRTKNLKRFTFGP